MTGIYFGLLFWWGVSVFYFLVGGTLYALWLLRRSRKPPRSQSQLPPVSILKPLCGLDPDLEENLRCFFELDYPKFEILFTVHQPTDPAAVVAQRLMQKYPSIPAQLFFSGEAGPHSNPKVVNAAPGFEAAKHALIFMADSTVRVKPDFLRRAVGYFSPSVGSVAAIITAGSENGLGGTLESVVMNTINARYLYLGRMLRIPFQWGKAVVFRKSIIDNLGGLRALENYLAEDFALGMRVIEAGYEAIMMDETAEEHSWACSLSDYWKRQLRWGRTRRYFSTTLAWFTPTGNSVFCGCLGAVAFQGLFEIPYWQILSFHFCFWFLCDLALYRALTNKLSFKFFWAWPLRELLDFPLWIAVMSGSTVEWKGRRLRIVGKDTRLVPASHCTPFLGPLPQEA